MAFMTLRRTTSLTNSMPNGANVLLEDGSKQVFRLKQSCTPTGAARKYLATITDVFLLNYAVSLDEARDET